jgi:hypothetical protein
VDVPIPAEGVSFTLFALFSRLQGGTSGNGLEMSELREDVVVIGSLLDANVALAHQCIKTSDGHVLPDAWWAGARVSVAQSGRCRLRFVVVAVFPRKSACPPYELVVRWQGSVSQ